MQEAVARFIGLRGLLAALFFGENTYFPSSGAVVTIVPLRAHHDPQPLSQTGVPARSP